MDAGDFLKGYIILGVCTVTAAFGVIWVGTWWACMLAFLGMGLAAHGLLEYYAVKILNDWEIEAPGACEAHRRMLPPWISTHGGHRHLCIDPKYSYRPKDRELIEEWKFF